MTLTKSWLQKQINEFESCAERTDGYRLDEGGKNTLAAIKLALAGMEAEPVAPDDVNGPLAYAYKELTPHFMRNHIAVFERYGTVVDGLTGIQAMRIALDGMERRAAMLQCADGNSPAVPDGWVACSERMPDKLIPVNVMYADGEMWSAMWTGTKWDDGTEFPDPHPVTHWQEMPAAPQQEDE